MIVAIEPELYGYKSLAYQICYPELSHAASLHMAGVHPGNKTPESLSMFGPEVALAMSDCRAGGMTLARIGHKFGCVPSTVSRTLQYYDLPSRKGVKR